MVSKEEIFEASGVQFMQINSLYQWYAMKLLASPALRVAKKLLFMPDLFNYWLTGVARAERTIASTSQFYDPRKGAFAGGMLKKLGLDASILAEVVDPGTRLGPLLPDIAEFSGLGAVPVYASGGHDTADAVVAVPAQSGHDWCYISSGTWSLMGVELDEPVIDAATLAENFTNEAGACGKIRFLRNIAGMWLLEECRAAWALEGHNFTYEELMESAAAAKPRTAVIDPDAFLEPGRDAAEDRGVLQSVGARGAARSGAGDAGDSRESGGEVQASPGEHRKTDGAEDSRDPHCRRRVAEPAAESTGGGHYGAGSDRGSGGGDGDRQCADSGDGRGGGEGFERGAGDCGEVVSGGEV